MPTYLVSQKLRTVADVFGEQQIRGFNFCSFDDDRRGEGRHAWEVSKEIVAPTFRDAFAESRNQLLPIVDAISVVTQCAASLAVTSHFVYRLDQNNNRIMFLYLTRRIPAVGITLDSPEQSRDIEKLLSIENAAIRYIRNSINASTLMTRLAMLVIAAEALAGQTQRTSKCRNCKQDAICPTCREQLPSFAGTDRDKLQSVLGREAHDALYVKNGGSLRHRLFHGATVPEAGLAEIVELTYSGIRAYLRDNYALESFAEEIIGAPRTLDNYEHGYHFIKLHDREVPRLKDLERKWEQLGDHIECEPSGY